MKKELKLVKINSDYCDYLRKFDSKVPYNFDKKDNRPFVGALLEVNNCMYFAPLSSPKPKHLKMRNNLDFFKIDNGKLGAVNFNNMLPVLEKNIELINLENSDKKIKEKKYKKLLQEQIYWLNRNSEKLYKKAEKIYFDYKNNVLPPSIKNRCCDFILLEEKCYKYKSN